MLILLLLLLLLLLIQGQHCWRSRSPSATEPTRCTIGPATAHRWATALGAACYATTSPLLFGLCKKFLVAKLLLYCLFRCTVADAVLVYDAATSRGSISRVKSHQPLGTWNVSSQCMMVHCTYPAMMVHYTLNCDWYFSPECWVMFRDLKSNGLSGQIPDEIGDCSLLETL